MAEQCQRCGTGFGFVDRTRGRLLCSECQTQQDQDRAQTKQAYATALRGAAMGLVVADNTASEVARLRDAAALPPAELASLNAQVWRETIESLVADDILSQAEFDRLESIAELMGGSIWKSMPPELFTRQYIARINGGWLPAVPAPTLLLKRGETAHLEMRVALMTEVVDRVRRGSYSGFSFQVANGVRFSTGRFQSQSVVLGSHLEVADQGTLYLTSLRVVFAGGRKTLELPYSKLLSVNVFTNGIRLQMSNRQSAPLFRVGDGPLVAAVVNAAYQRL